MMNIDNEVMIKSCKWAVILWVRPFVCLCYSVVVCVCLSGCSVKKLRCRSDDFKRLSGATAASNNRS